MSAICIHVSVICEKTSNIDQDAIKLIYGKYHEVLYSDPRPILEAYVITTVCIKVNTLPAMGKSDLNHV